VEIESSKANLREVTVWVNGVEKKKGGTDTVGFVYEGATKRDLKGAFSDATGRYLVTPPSFRRYWVTKSYKEALELAIDRCREHRSRLHVFENPRESWETSRNLKVFVEYHTAKEEPKKVLEEKAEKAIKEALMPLRHFEYENYKGWHSYIDDKSYKHYIILDVISMVELVAVMNALYSVHGIHAHVYTTKYCELCSYPNKSVIDNDVYQCTVCKRTTCRDHILFVKDVKSLKMGIFRGIEGRVCTECAARFEEAYLTNCAIEKLPLHINGPYIQEESSANIIRRRFSGVS